MKKFSALLLICCILLMLTLSVSFFGCYPEVTVTVTIEGEAYRGAVCSIFAIVKGADEYTEVEFEIVEDYDWVSINGNELLFTKNAVVGATVTVKATIDGYEGEKSITVGHTPINGLAIEEIPILSAGDSYPLTVTTDPFYADDLEVSYEVILGENVATVNDGILYISNEANYTDDIRLIARVGEKTSETVFVKISTVQPETLQLYSDKYTLKRGEQAKITCIVTPSNCTLGTAELIVPESKYYTYNPIGILTVSDNAPEGEIEIIAKLGVLTQSIKLRIVKTPVEKIEFTASKNSYLHAGDNVELFTQAFPENATYNEITVEAVLGAEYIEFTSKLSFIVTTAEVGKKITLYAHADGVDAYLSFETVAIDVEDILISFDGSVSVTVGSERELYCAVKPSNATYKDVTLTISKGSEYASIDGNRIIFDSISDTLTEVEISVSAGEITRTVMFYIVPVPVERIELTTKDVTTELKSNDTVTFDAAIFPSDATYSDIEYRFESGEQLGFFVGNTFKVNDPTERGRVVIYAVSRDGIRSNSITLEIFGNITELEPLSWSELDNSPNLLDGCESVRIDFSELNIDADYTTLIISDDVEYLELIGNYDGTDHIISNLSFYFLTTDSVYVRFENFAIENNGGFSDYVIDFGNYATITLEIVGENYIKASSVYKPSAAGFMVDGAFTGESTDYIRKNGMSGFNGTDGGTAINVKSIEIIGSGNIELVAGSGSDGTDGTNGANASGKTFAGNGGDGGAGGNSGYALTCETFICNIEGKLILSGANGALGGKGGKGGIADDGYSGSDGNDGVNGIARNPLLATVKVEYVTENCSIKLGNVVGNSAVRVFVFDEFAEMLSKYYKINVHYGTDLDNPHSQFKMVALTSAVEINRMLSALDYALQSFPKNLYIEMVQSSKKDIDIYIVKSITKSSSEVYGLTSDANNVWFETFDTRLRGVYYSTPYNIMIHELLHVLTYNLDNATDSSLKKTLPSYNLSYSYRTNSIGVYDPTNGYDEDNSVFLCKYSKSSYNEDISDNLSMIAMLPKKEAYLEEDKPMYLKVRYITSVYVGYYSTLSDRTEFRWNRFI